MNMKIRNFRGAKTENDSAPGEESLNEKKVTGNVSLSTKELADHVNQATENALKKQEIQAAKKKKKEPKPAEDWSPFVLKTTTLNRLQFLIATMKRGGEKTYMRDFVDEVLIRQMEKEEKRLGILK